MLALIVFFNREMYTEIFVKLNKHIAQKNTLINVHRRNVLLHDSEVNRVIFICASICGELNVNSILDVNKNCVEISIILY